MIDEALKQQVVNWMNEEQVDGTYIIRTSREAKKYFNLDVTIRSINSWVKNIGITKRDFYKLAKEKKREEAINLFLRTEDKRNKLREKVIIDLEAAAEGGYTKTDIEAIRNLNAAINEVLGTEAIRELEEIEREEDKQEIKVELDLLKIKK